MSFADGVREACTMCLAVMPEWAVGYIRVNMNTSPKILNHLLLAMGFCNFFFIFSAMKFSFLVFLASILLAGQTFTVLLTANHDQISFAPPSLAPTDLIVGLCLGLSIGGTILAFFTSTAFGQARRFCQTQVVEGASPCGTETATLTGIWWWSSLIFWLDLFTSVVLASGHHEIATSSTGGHQYQTIHNQADSMGQPSRYHETTPQQPGPSSGLRGGGYNDVGDVPQSGIPPTSGQVMSF